MSEFLYGIVPRVFPLYPKWRRFEYQRGHASSGSFLVKTTIVPRVTSPFSLARLWDEALFVLRCQVVCM